MVMKQQILLLIALLIGMLVFAATPGHAADTPAEAAKKLNGYWIVQSAESGGKIATSADRQPARFEGMLVRNGKITIVLDGTESKAMSFTVDQVAAGLRVQLIEDDPKAAAASALIVFDKDKLKICIHRPTAPQEGYFEDTRKVRRGQCEIPGLHFEETG